MGAINIIEAFGVLAFGSLVWCIAYYLWHELDPWLSADDDCEKKQKRAVVVAIVCFWVLILSIVVRILVGGIE